MELSKEDLKAAREWIIECLGTWRDIESEEDVEELSDAQVIKGIEKHYNGGIQQFIQDGKWMKQLGTERVSGYYCILRQKETYQNEQIKVRRFF